MSNGISIGSSKGTAEPASILGSNKFLRLQDGTDDVDIVGFKDSCSSVWCSDCFVSKGGSKRFSNRLAQLDYKATRQAVLTVDPKQFDNDPEKAFKHLQAVKAIPQFIHNLKRTEKIKVVDWVWVLEWHTNGFPHWHLFIQTERGKKGMIGNKALLKQWRYGLVLESYVHSEKHWRAFTDYFGNHGYFDPRKSPDKKDKTHQLALPDWAKKQRPTIRKTGSMVKKTDEVEPTTQKLLEEESQNNDVIEKTVILRSYGEILNSCGQSTICKFRAGVKNEIWKKIKIPYWCFKQYPGEYIKGIGYVLKLKPIDFTGFMALHDFDPTKNTKWHFDN